MRLLFDENLSPRLATALAEVFPDSAHVHRMGLGSATDNEVWEYARSNGYTLVSKDSDFHELSLLRGYPPKVIWIRRGNCTTGEIENLLRRATPQIRGLHEDPEATFLLLL